MLLNNSTAQAQTATNALSLIKDSLNLYLQNSFAGETLSERDKWPEDITRSDFHGRDSQHKDYVLALLSHGVYHNNWNEIQGVERLTKEKVTQLGIDADLLTDDATGFQANICRFKDLYIICFAGSNDLVDFYANVRQGLGYYEPQYFQAVGLTNILFNAVKGNIICTGHSLGGGLASIAALASQSPCITFSPAGLAKNTVKHIGMDYNMAKKIADEGLIRFYLVQYDWLDTLQNTLPIPSSLGNRIKMAYSEHDSWKDWLPHRLLTRSFIAHSMVKIVRMMCKYQPWNNWNALTGDYEEKKGTIITELPTPEEIKATTWQESCKNAIKNGNITEFSQLIKLNEKQADIVFLAKQSVGASNSQFMQLLIESPYGKTIKNIQSMQQKSILHLAAQSGRIAQSQILLKNGSMVNLKDNLGNTPLHDALNSHALAVAELLLVNGADWRMKNNQGYDCRDVLDNHILKLDTLTQEGKMMREKIIGMMN